MKTISWIGKILAILYILFISLFALDVFGENVSFFKMLIGLFMHLIPSLILVILLILAFYKERTAGILFLIIGIVFTIFFKTYQDWFTITFISLPLIIIGLLFLLNKRK